MKNKYIACCLAFSLLTGCAHVSEEALRPVMGLQWYASPEEVRTQLSGLHLLEERESIGYAGEWQLLLDYDVTEFYHTSCTLTLCFTSLGLVGLNYHDIGHEKTYPEWSLALEGVYGIPTEESKGLSAWYENPLGKNTSIYLFNLEEGVQISFYIEYSGSEKSVIPDQEEEPETIANIAPMPETRTPVIPADPPIMTTEATEITEADQTTAVSDQSIPESTSIPESDPVMTDRIQTEAQNDPEEIPQTIPSPEMPEIEMQSTAAMITETSHSETAISSTTTSTTTTTSTSTTTTITSAPPAEPEIHDPLNGLTFYMTPEQGRRCMGSYSQLYEYRTEEPGQPWELIMEYENINFYDHAVQSVLCFTSLGLVGVNYFDENPGNYSHWVKTLSDHFDPPSESQADYAAWTDTPDGIQIYIFSLEDGVQISFFADDTGSALS